MKTSNGRGIKNLQPIAQKRNLTKQEIKIDVQQNTAKDVIPIGEDEEEDIELAKFRICKRPCEVDFQEDDLEVQAALYGYYTTGTFSYQE